MNMDERNKIIDDNVGLIKSIIKKILIRRQYRKSSFNKDDLFQEGVIALMDAVRTYDNNRNIKFTTYVHNVIYLHLADFIDNNQMVRIPLSTNRKVKNTEYDDNLSHRLKNALKIVKNPIASLDKNYDLAVHYDKNKVDIRDYIDNLLMKLDSSSRELIVSYFGIGRDSISMEEIAKNMNVSRPLISYRIKNIIEKLSKIPL